MALRVLGNYLTKEVGKTSSKVKDFLTLDPKREKVIKNGTILEKLGGNCLVRFDDLMADFILAGAGGSVVVRPEGLLKCIALGRIEYGKEIYNRFYLDGSDDVRRFLQVVTNNGQIVDGETKLYQLLTDYTPTSYEDWHDWRTNPKSLQLPLILGNLDVSFCENQAYRRLWGVDSEGNGAEFFEPKAFREKITTSAYGEPEFLNINAVEYYRPVGDLIEYMWLSTIHHRPKVGKEERWVEAYVGLSIDPNQLIVIAAP